MAARNINTQASTVASQDRADRCPTRNTAAAKVMAPQGSRQQISGTRTTIIHLVKNSRYPMVLLMASSTASSTRNLTTGRIYRSYCS